MAYTEEEIDAKFTEICDKMATGRSLRTILKYERDMPSKSTFFKWVDSSELRTNQYARAHEDRAEEIFEEITDIADNSNLDYEVVDGKLVVNGEAVQRSKLKIDARKWQLSKMLPKKYGDKLLHEGNQDNPIKIDITFTD